METSGQPGTALTTATVMETEWETNCHNYQE